MTNHNVLLINLTEVDVVTVNKRFLRQFEAPLCDVACINLQMGAIARSSNAAAIAR